MTTTYKMSNHSGFVGSTNSNKMSGRATTQKNGGSPELAAQSLMKPLLHPR